MLSDLRPSSHFLHLLWSTQWNQLAQLDNLLVGRWFKDTLLISFQKKKRMPVNIQYSTFTLLVVYYANMETREKSKRRELRRRYLILWAASNTVLVLLGIGRECFYLGGSDCFFQLGLCWGLYSIRRRRIPCGCRRFMVSLLGQCSSYLSSSLGGRDGESSSSCSKYGYYRGESGGLLTDWLQGEHPQLESKVSFTKIAIVTILLFLSFISRCSFNFITSIATYTVQVEAVSDSTLHTHYLVAIHESHTHKGHKFVCTPHYACIQCVGNPSNYLGAGIIWTSSWYTLGSIFKAAYLPWSATTADQRRKWFTHWNGTHEGTNI